MKNKIADNEALYTRFIGARWMRREVWTEVNNAVTYKYGDDNYAHRRYELIESVKSMEKCGVVALFAVLTEADLDPIDSTSHLILGWSYCNPEDQFNKDKAINIAHDRACRLYRENPDREITDIELDKLPDGLRKWVVRQGYELLADYRIEEYDNK